MGVYRRPCTVRAANNKQSAIQQFRQVYDAGGRVRGQERSVTELGPRRRSALGRRLTDQAGPSAQPEMD
jgi:hypothetical protein